MSALISTYRQPGLVAIHLVFVSLVISIAGCSKQLPTEQARTEAVDVVMDDKTSHQRMLDELKRIEKLTPESNPYLGNRDARELKLEFEAEAEKGNDVEAWFALLKLAGGITTGSGKGGYRTPYAGLRDAARNSIGN